MNAVLTTAAAVFKLAVRRKLATGNPAADAERAFMGAPSLGKKRSASSVRDGVQPLRPEEVLSPNEIRKLLEKAQPGYYRTLFLTAYLTGMRSGELFALRWSDVELKGIGPETGRECYTGESTFAARFHGLALKKMTVRFAHAFFHPKPEQAFARCRFRWNLPERSAVGNCNVRRVKMNSLFR